METLTITFKENTTREDAKELKAIIVRALKNDGYSVLAERVRKGRLGKTK